MKKYLFTLLALFIILPVTVFAEEPRVLTLDTGVSGNEVTFSGTTENDSHAVMCKLYDANDHEKDMLSVAVDNGTFSGSFRITATGNYKVACANYEGGAIKSDMATASEVISITHTITFDTNGGSNINEVIVNDGEIIEPPEVPEREGFKFVEWCIDDTLTTAFDFNEPITGNILLYARWAQIEYVTVHTIFNGEGGKYVVDFYSVGIDGQGPIGEELSSSAMYTLEKGTQMILWVQTTEGFRFDGWYRVHEEDTDGEGHMEWRLDDKMSSDVEFRFTPTENIYISPVFESENNEPKKFMVEFVTNGGNSIEPVEIERDGVVPMPENPERGGYRFVEWCIDDTLTTSYDFDTRVTGDLVLYAKWEATGETYIVPDEGGNEITFVEEEGHEFSFAMLNLAKISEEELLELTGGEINKEQFDEALEVLKEAVSDEGTFVAVYEIIVVDENDDELEYGPFTIKINKTPEMEKYDSFKLLYVNTDNGFDVEEVIELDDRGEYLLGTLQHLSAYVLVGNVVNTPASNNPQTLDNIYIWIITLLVSMIGLTTLIVTNKKLQRFKAR